MNSRSPSLDRTASQSYRFGDAGRTNARFENAHFTHAGFGYNRSAYGHDGYGHGSRHDYGRYGYGRDWHRGGWHSGWYGDGWNDGGDGFWFLNDLFGLALNFGALAITPWSPVASFGWNLLDAGVEALDNSDNYDQQRSDYQAQFDLDDQQSYPTLCGNYYSDENPGCLQ
jgi:hypothetical protein